MSYSVQTFDLAVDRRGDAAESRNVGGVRIVQCVALPTGAQDVRIRLDDEADYVPLVVGRRFERCNGLIYKVTLRNAPTGGLLEIYAGSDPVPFDGGGGAGVDSAADNSFIDLAWPTYARLVSIGGAWVTTATARQGIPGATIAIWAGAAGAGTNTMNVMLPDTGWICGRLVAPRSINIEECPVHLVVAIPAGVPPGWKLPDQGRIWRYDYTWRQVAGVPGINTGFGFTWSGGLVGNYVQGAFSLCGDGAGGMQIRGYQFGISVPTITVPIPWPVALTVPVTITWICRCADGTRNAFVELWVNGVLLWRQEWLDAAGMPMPNDAGVLDANKLVPYVNAGDAGNEVRISNVRYRVGRFDALGSVA